MRAGERRRGPTRARRYVPPGGDPESYWTGRRFAGTSSTCQASSQNHPGRPCRTRPSARVTHTPDEATTTTSRPPLSRTSRAPAASASVRRAYAQSTALPRGKTAIPAMSNSRPRARPRDTARQAQSRPRCNTTSSLARSWRASTPGRWLGSGRVRADGLLASTATAPIIGAPYAASTSFTARTSSSRTTGSAAMVPASQGRPCRGIAPASPSNSSAAA